MFAGDFPSLLIAVSNTKKIVLQDLYQALKFYISLSTNNLINL